jgi:L-ascorbate metabolism protein UlaG (beta-lactamase superfamily)
MFHLNQMPIILFLSFLMFSMVFSAKHQFQTDTISTAEGPLQITFIKHATLMFNYDGKVIHVDPVGQYADYSQMPKADLILVTHHHGDHLDPEAIEKIRKDNTVVICTETCAEKIDNATVMNNDDSMEVMGIEIKAVPAYNIVHKRNSGDPYHPKGVGNGYVLTMGGKKVYIAGDTENIPEMKNLPGIDIAFLPMNLPYTMTPEMVADAVEMIHPKVLYPYHYGDTDVNKLLELLKDKKYVEVRVREME